MSADIDDKPQPLLDHLIELRRRLLWAVIAFFAAFLVCFYFGKQLFNLLVVPYRTAVIWSGMDVNKAELIYTAPQEFFFTQIKVAMFGALVLAFPVIATQIYRFVAPGLYKNERAAFLPFLVASPVLFLLGGALVYFLFTPMVMWFFLTMQQTGGADQVAISLMPKVSEYLSLIMTLIISFGLVFQLPVITSLLIRADLISSKALGEKRKYAIVIAFIVAAVLTPPDPISQLGLAIPTIMLYEIAILSGKMIERGRMKRRAEEAAAEAAEEAAETAAKSEAAAEPAKEA